MSIAEFARRTRLWTRFRSAMVLYWLPLVALALIPVAITLVANVPVRDWQLAGFIAAVLACVLTGFVVARLATDNASEPKWAMQSSLLPFAIYGAVAERSLVNFLILAVVTGALLFNAVAVLRRAAQQLH